MEYADIKKNVYWYFKRFSYWNKVIHALQVIIGLLGPPRLALVLFLNALQMT
jgi:hypothetical protein